MTDNKPKHRIKCPASLRIKMLFKTEKEALGFIKYNGSNVNKYLRAYYCDACCGWHITHQKPRDTDDYINYSNLITGKQSLVEKIKSQSIKKTQSKKEISQNKIKKVENPVISVIKPITIKVLGHIDIKEEVNTKESKRERREEDIKKVKQIDANIVYLDKLERHHFYILNHLTGQQRHLVESIIKLWNTKGISKNFSVLVESIFNYYLETGIISVKTAKKRIKINE